MIRSIARSNGVRCSRRPWKRAEIRSTPGTRSLPTASITWSPNPSSRLITACISRNSARCSSVISRSSQCMSSRRPSPRSAAPRARTASRPSDDASSENSESWRSRRPARYGRSQGCASNSKACVVSWSAIQVRNGSSGTSITLAVWRMFSSTNSRRPGVVSALRQREVVLAEHPLAHEPQQQTQLAGGDPAVGERHRGLADAAARRQHLVEEVPLEAADEAGEDLRVGTHPGGAIDDGHAVHDARQLRARGGRRGPARRGPSRWRSRPRSNAALPRPGRRGRAGVARSRCPRPGASRRGPPPRAECSSRRPATVTAAPTTEPTTNPTCHRRSSGIRRPPAGAAGAGTRHQPTSRSATASTSGKDSPNIRDAIDRKRSTSPVVSWTWHAGAPYTSAGRE